MSWNLKMGLARIPLNFVFSCVLSHYLFGWDWLMGGLTIWVTMEAVLPLVSFIYNIPGYILALGIVGERYPGD